jgi:hypothetical protein
VLVMSSFMKANGARIVDNGFPVLPLIPNSKVPGSYISGEWRPYKDWSRHCVRETQTMEVDIWSRWPEAGIGIACGRIVGVDIDIVQDAAIASRVEALARRLLGDTPALRIGLAPKRMLVYRTETPFGGFKKHPIEILGRGQQFVAEGVHPETGQPYYWPGESLADLDISQLPAVTEAQCRAFADAAYELLPPELRPAVLGGDDNGQPHTSSEKLAGNPDAVEDALRHIPNPDLPYDDWIRIGFAIKGAVGDAGEALYHRWSERSAKYDPAATERAWRSFQPHSIGTGALFFLASKYGWRCPPHIVLDRASMWEPGNHPAQEFLDKVEAAVQELEPEPEPQPVPVPEAFFNPGGVLGEFVEYVLASAVRPQPILALAAAIAAVGVLAGRRYRSPSNLRTNVYVVGMAASGGGKDHARKCAVEALAKVGCLNLIGGDHIASGQGLITALEQQPAMLFQLDEFGHVLASIANKAKNPPHLYQIWDNLTKLFTTAASTYMGAEYANKKDNPRKVINKPCCVVHATTVPGPFWSALQSGAASDGSLARWLLFQTDNPIPEHVKNPQDIDAVPDAVIEGFQAIKKGADGWDDKALAFGASGDPKAYLVPYEDGAETALDAIRDALRPRQIAQVNTPQEAILARIHEHIIKIALIKAISDNPAQPIITAGVVRWAETIVNWCTDAMLRDAEFYISDNEMEANHKKVLDIIRKARSAGISRSNLLRKTQYLGKKGLEPILDTLLESHQIIDGMVTTSGRYAKVFKIAKYST